MGTSAGVPDQHSRKDGEARDPHAVAQMHLGDGLAVHWARLITRSRSGAATSVAGSDDCLLLLCYGVWNRRCCTAIPFITLKKKGIMNQEYQLHVMPKKISMPVRTSLLL
ncbi:uncharacterized protein [Miscanthus floridulus]|uniref:uncharacterized protein n=1 Tax=Miscanthus floridulus TaxID=154761 RepID=UPI00345A4094